MGNKNVMDVLIVDLEGNYYDINSIHMQGNDSMGIVIKKPSEDYVSFRKGRELVEKYDEDLKKRLRV